MRDYPDDDEYTDEPLTITSLRPAKTGLTVACPVCRAWIGYRCFGPRKGDTREEAHPERLEREVAGSDWLPTEAMQAMEQATCPDCGAKPGYRCWGGRGFHADTIHPARVTAWKNGARG